MKASHVLLAAIPLGVLAFYLVPRAEAATRYLVTGSSTVAPILQAVAERLEAREPSLRIEVETGGTGRGIKDAREGLNDLGMASRELTAEESAGLTPIAIAHDGVALIVHASNPVDELTREQVVAIYRGESGDWSALGAPSGDITVIHKAEGRSTLEVFLQHFGLAATEVRADVVIGDNAQGIRLVAGDPRALAYVSIGDVERALAEGVPIKKLRYGGVLPSVASVADGSYPIRRTLFLLFHEPIDPVGRRILDHLASAEGRQLLQELGFVPLEPSR